MLFHSEHIAKYMYVGMMYCYCSRCTPTEARLCNRALHRSRWQLQKNVVIFQDQFDVSNSRAWEPFVSSQFVKVADNAPVVDSTGA